MEKKFQYAGAADLIRISLVILLINLWLLWLWSRRNLYKFALTFPGHFGLPLIGSLLAIRDYKALLPTFSKLFERYKSGSICVWLGLYPMVFTSDPQYVATILSSPVLLNKSKLFYMPLNEAFQGGLVTSPASIWQHSRKLINPAFSHKVLLSFVTIFQRGKNILLSKLEKLVDNEEHKIFDLIQFEILGISVETTMGKIMEQDDPVKHTLLFNFNFLMDRVVYHIMMTSIGLHSLHRLYFKFYRIKKQLYDFVLCLVQEKLMRMKSHKEWKTETVKVDSTDSMKKSPNIFIDQAIENYLKQKFTLHDIIVESNTITAASLETTANGIFSTLLMLAMHPTVQERLYEDILNIYPDKNMEMEYEHLDQLPYLDMIISETLRVAPPIPLIGRHITEDTTLFDGVVLPKDLHVIVPIYHVHRRKDYWGPNANNFDPDNFLPENIKTRHPYAYIPFSKGLRNCIGWRYALMAMKFIIVGIVRNYRLTTSTEYDDIEITFQIAMKYLNEPSFKIYRRE